MNAEMKLASHLIPPVGEGRQASNLIELEAFRTSSLKLAVQKDGELTTISLALLRRSFAQNITTAELFKQGSLVTTINNGTVGLLSARNKSICQLVASGSVDAALVGLDQVFESGRARDLIILKELREIAEWDIVLATPTDRKFSSVYEIVAVASQYPIIAQAYFSSIGHQPEIIHSHGSTEAMPFVKYHGKQIDGIVDLRATGKTLEAHNLVPWEPPITKVYPVIIANQELMDSPQKLAGLRAIFGLDADLD